MAGQRPSRVLHVVESYGSGSLTAAVQYVRSTPELEHHVLRRVRDDYVPFGEAELFSSTRDLPASNLRCRGAVRRAVRDLAPDVVHAHSSLAGLFVRLALRAGGPARIVYTPHCFVFERTSASPALRRLYRAVEWLLALNTSVIAACSEGEERVARGWRTCRRSVHVPNFVAPWPDRSPDRSPGRTPAAVPTIVSIGRLTAQKDPDHFLAVVREVVARGVEARSLWIGGGSPDDVARLEAAGVEVTGWISRDDVMDRLGTAAVYVHTAAWEGFPMSVLEAHRAGLPIVVRDIAAFSAFPAELRARTPAELADRVVAVLDPAGGAALLNRSLCDEAMRENSEERQRARLLEAYDVA